MLQRRGKVFASRVFVPKGLQEIFGRVEITRSLRTMDAREASRRLAFWEQHLRAFFNQVERYGALMTHDELEELTQRYLETQFDEIEDRLALPWQRAGLEEWVSQLNARCHMLSAALAHADTSPTDDVARELAPNADELSQRKLARRLTEAQLKAGIAEIKAINGDELKRPPRSTGSSPAKKRAKPTPKISEVALLYSEERVAQGRWSDKTAAQGERIFRVIADLLGDPPIGDIGKDQIRRAGLDIAKLPANMAKKFPGKTPTEILAELDDLPTLTRLEPRSINKYYQHLRTLFAWAVEHDHLAQNPAVVLHDVEEGRAQDARKVFDDEDIEKLFAKLSEKAKEPYGFWIPRIMAFTGCRMGEAAQLRKADIRMERSVWVFDFNDDSEQKSLKTDGSARLVPVHPRLIELGLLDFVSACDDEFLFPLRVRFTEGSTRGNVDRLSKQLNRWLRLADITDRRKTFQSFRGTFATRLKDLGVPEYQIAELMGHENDNITSGRYGKRTKLGQLYAVISRLNLPI